MQSLIYSVYVFTGFSGLQILMISAGSNWETEHDGKKLSFLQSLRRAVMQSVIMLASMLGVTWVAIIVSYAWKIAGVEPFS